MLTQKQEGFTLDVFKGEPYSVAYNNNYDSKGMTQNAIYVEASRLMDNPKVALRLQALNKPMIDKTIATKKQILSKLSSIAIENIQTERGIPIRNSNIQAASELAKLQGWYTPEVQELNVNWTLIDKRKDELIERNNVQRQEANRLAAHYRQEE